MRVQQMKGVMCVAAVAGMMAATGHGQEIDILDTQIQYNRGMNVAPLYEGWTKTPDGTIEFWFGYLNRNWEEVLHIPVELGPLMPARASPARCG